ncbi:MAG: dihydropteroate synthase [Treponema sp.]|nr:dihydropteroate synthase [Treponema sp.]
MRRLYLKNRILETKFDSFIMGIINANNDSFFEKSRGGIERALKLIQEGADILDIGAESTRPGAEYISSEKEIESIVPLVKEIRKHSSIPISIDTRKKIVLEKALEVGADILNDVSALEDDSELADFVAFSKIPVILMHKRGSPKTMQDNTEYADVFLEVNDYLQSRVTFALSKGILKEHIILDPGIGFGKDVKANCLLTKKCGILCNGEYPVLVGLSRKSFLEKITGRLLEDRLTTTMATNLFAIQGGASILRVHDVRDTADILKVAHFFKET